MLTLEKMAEAQNLANAQLNAIKNRAIALWGEKWLARLAEKYKEVAELDSQCDSTVRRWFRDGSNVKPSLESFNNLLLATGCQMVIEAPEQIIKAQRIL